MKQLYTTWGEQLQMDHVLEEYPRPTLVRNSYQNLNGLWDYAFTQNDVVPSSFDGKICVPFSPEAILSGVDRQLQPDEYLWYHRQIPVDYHKLQQGYGLILHFGAVDQTATVFINEQEVTTHIGGYLPFSIDVTPYLTSQAEDFSLVLRVLDVSDTSYHAKGKQKLNRGGMYYTAQSGIWQTVWMEYVPPVYIADVSCSVLSDIGEVTFSIAIRTGSKEAPKTQLPLSFKLHAPRVESTPMVEPAAHIDSVMLSPILQSRSDIITYHRDTSITYTIEDAQISHSLWSPEHPYLFFYEITLGQDTIVGYFASRTITKEQDETGIPRICLNHKSIFQKGVLDQGYWPDGLMTAPSDEAFLFDIENMKATGFNMLRKHIKIEPERFYYHCDRLGMFVWQDMVNGGEPYKDWYVTYLATLRSLFRRKTSDRWLRLLARNNDDGRKEWEAELLSTITLLKKHPCICTWVIFNEGWGQFETERMTDLAREADTTRLIDATSGWYDQGCGDMNSFHNYFFSMKIPKDRFDDKRVAVCSEFGGYSYAIAEHCTDAGLYGYGTYKDFASLQKAYEARDAKVMALIPKGLCASVYTQVSDIEDEVNGIYTYDRKVKKIK